METEARFWSKVEKSEGCWTWNKGVMGTGYGQFYADGRQVLAHRYVYEITYGPIPPGMVVDHECHNDSDCAGGRDCPHRRCVNPAHLFLKTKVENVAASHLANSKKTHCPRGHEYTPENTRIQSLKTTTRRSCRTCAKEMDWNPKRAEQQRARRAARRSN